MIFLDLPMQPTPTMMTKDQHQDMSLWQLEVQLPGNPRNKQQFWYHQLKPNMLWKEETEPVVLRVTSAQRAQLRTRLYLYVLSKVATSNQMTKNKTDVAQQHRVRPSKREITTRTCEL